MEAENKDAKDLKETDSQTDEEQKKPRTVIHIELIKQMVKDNKAFLTHMQQISDRKSQHLEKNILKLEKSLNRYEKTLKEIQARHEIVEDTLCNVLLAIRQNEYLQAWYPEQKGYPAQKVVGQHPFVKKRGKSEKALQ